MKARIIITAQYSENYAFPEWNGEGKCPDHWKFKSGQTFEVEADSMDVMYMEEECISVVKEMLNELSNDRVKYEYRSHEVKFGKDLVLDSVIFNDKLKSLTTKKTA